MTRFERFVKVASQIVDNILGGYPYMVIGYGLGAWSILSDISSPIVYQITKQSPENLFAIIAGLTLACLVMVQLIKSIFRGPIFKTKREGVYLVTRDKYERMSSDEIKYVLKQHKAILVDEERQTQ